MRQLRQILIALLAYACLVSVSGCGIDALLDDSSLSSPPNPTPDNIADAALAPKPASTSEVYGAGVICLGSFSTFKNRIRASSKDPGSGFQWHHVVNQNPANRKRFGSRLHCTDNLISLPKATHKKISGHYSSKQPWTNGLRIRDAVAKQSWRAQYEYGLKVLRDHGVTP